MTQQATPSRQQTSRFRRMLRQHPEVPDVAKRSHSGNRRRRLRPRSKPPPSPLGRAGADADASTATLRCGAPRNGQARGSPREASTHLPPRGHRSGTSARFRGLSEGGSGGSPPRLRLPRKDGPRSQAESGVPEGKRLKGFEPSTFCMASRRSSQLSYSRTKADSSFAARFPASGTLGVPVRPFAIGRLPANSLPFPRPKLAQRRKRGWRDLDAEAGCREWFGVP